MITNAQYFMFILFIGEKVVRLMDEVESLFTQHFANSDRKKAMKFLRPQQNKESHMVTFFVGNSSLTTHPPTPLYIKIETKHKKFKYPSLYVSLDPSICI